MLKLSDMGKLILLFALMMAFSNCMSKKGKQTLSWTESQVLCIYWSPKFEMRDTLSAINFIIESNSDYVLKSAEYLFHVGQRNYPLKKSSFVNKGKYFLQGLKLECKVLYDEYKDDIYTEGGPCYEDSLTKMVKDGKLFLKAALSQEIPKNKHFSLYKGLKNR